MAEYEFTFKFALTDAQADPADYVERLAEAGCDDALLGLGKKGRIALEFVREAASARDAVMSAFADARKALPNAQLIEVSPDLVGLTDIAEVMACSRQNVRKIVLLDSSFPTAIHEGSLELFHLADVLAWAGHHRTGRSVDVRILEVASVNREINLANQLRVLKRRQVSAEIASLCNPERLQRQ
jgi:hypothetical protein